MRTSQIKLSMELMSKDLTDKICEKDQVQYHEQPEYVTANADQYYLGINTWLCLIEDVAGKGTRFRISCYIVDNGLRSAIDTSCTAANHLIGILSGNRIEVPEDVISWESLFPSSIVVQDALTCMRFLKRFTLDKSESLELASYAKFLSQQKALNWRYQAKLRSKDPDVVRPTNRWTTRVSEIIGDLLSGWDEWLGYTQGNFGNGNCSDGKTLYEKIQSYARYSYNRGGSPLYPIGGSATRKVEVYEPDVITVEGVPKSYKAYRIIAPETAFGSYWLQRLRKCIIATLSTNDPFLWSFMDVEDQERQQVRAHIGSTEGIFCTYDLSGASDSIALYWADQVFPEDLLDAIYQLRAPKVRVGDKVTVLSTFLTSGNPCTFVLETLFFWTLAFVAKELHEEWTGETILWPSAFGDDMIVDYRCCDELESIFKDFDLVINHEKSFTTGNYRESCGVEYLDGEPMKSIYWPRARILTSKKPSAEDYASLVSLQHRVYSYPQAAMFIEQAVLFWWPKATKSAPGLVGVLDESTDLWSAFPTCIRRKAPFGAWWLPEAESKGRLPEDFPDQAPEWMYREAHTGLRQHYAKDLPEGWYQSGAMHTLEMWLYTEFLMYGPQYASPLDELLKVSEPRLRQAYLADPKLSVELLS